MSPSETITLDNGARVLVYPDGIAIVSPESSPIRTVWKESDGDMHHVIEWGATPMILGELDAASPDD